MMRKPLLLFACQVGPCLGLAELVHLIKTPQQHWAFKFGHAQAVGGRHPVMCSHSGVQMVLLGLCGLADKRCTFEPDSPHAL